MSVYVVHKPRATGRGPAYDLSPATEYGEIKFVFDANFSPSTNVREAQRRAYEALADFDPQHDFLVWAGGDPFALFLCGAVLSDVTDGVLPFLRWERYKVPQPSGLAGYYAPVHVRLPSIVPTSDA